MCVMSVMCVILLCTVLNVRMLCAIVLCAVLNVCVMQQFCVRS